MVQMIRRIKKKLLVYIAIGFVMTHCNNDNRLELDQVRKLIEHQHYQEALDKLDSFDPQLSSVLKLKGICYFSEGDYAPALKYFTRAAEKTTDNLELYIYTGQCEENLQLPDRALTSYDRALRIDKNNAFANFRKGKILFLNDSVEKAIFYYKASIKNDSLNYNVFNDLGLAYENKKKYELAIYNYSKAIFLNPTDAGLYFNRAVSFFYLEKYENAVNDYSSAIKLKENPLFYFNRGISYFYLNELSMACEDWNIASQNGSTEAKDYIEKYCTSQNNKKVIPHRI